MRVGNEGYKRYCRLVMLVGMLTRAALAAAAPADPGSAMPRVVVNEVFHTPPSKASLEFVELFNPGPEVVDLSGWTLNRFEFPAGSSVASGGFVVVAEDPRKFQEAYHVKALGPLSGHLSRRGDRIIVRDAAKRVVEEFRYGAGFPWPSGAEGEWVSMERLNPGLPAADPANWRNSKRVRGPDQLYRYLPTPGATNSVFTTNAPPSVREVSHSPLSPRAGEAVTVVAAVSDPDRVQSVRLRLQEVDPGNYIRRGSSEYLSQWTELPMHDDGVEGDRQAGDGIYTVRISGTTQVHRRLVRYQIVAEDGGGRAVRIPYPDDPGLNFAWFVYDGVPAWSGSARPGKDPTVRFPGDFLQTLPVYHLIGDADDVSNSQWNGGAQGKKFFGTFVYNGVVYDHVQFRIRGKASTYVAGKNKWEIDFPRTHEFAARDAYGRPYRDAWDKLDLNACASPWAPVNRGMAGMDEAVSFRAFGLAGVPASPTHWVHFRVIDQAAESSPTNQFEGDLWGLYLAVLEPGSDWMKELGLPDGNLFSPERGQVHRARGMPEDGSDRTRLQEAVSNLAPVQWWRQNFDLDAFYSFHAINRVVANIDLRADGNHYLYRSPMRGWTAVPWDLDMMMIPRTHWPGVIPEVACLQHAELKLEYKNRGREILDLFCADAAPDGGQVGQLVSELARQLVPPGFSNSWPQLDMAMWNQHPRSNNRGVFYRNPFTDHGRQGGPWQRTLRSADFDGFCHYIVDFCTDSRPEGKYRPNDGNQLGYGFGFLRYESKDALAPQRPTIRYLGPPDRAPEQLRFAAAAYESVTNGAPFSAIQWRVAWISAPGRAGHEDGQPWHYELEPTWLSAPMDGGGLEVAIPAKTCVAGRTYRARARFRDIAGRWGHWSAPIEFVAGRRSVPGK